MMASVILVILFYLTCVVSHDRYISAGYKALNVDYDHNGHVNDPRIGEPVLGMSARF